MKKNIAITTITLMVITLINRILGFAREFLIAYYFGAGYESDSFFIANTIPNFIATLFISGTLSAAFIPVFIDIKSKNNKESINLFETIFTWIIIISAFIMGILLLFSKNIISIIAPGLSTAELYLTSNLFIIMIPMIMFLLLSGLLTAINQANHSFNAPMMAIGFSNVVLILFVLCTVKSIGIYALAYGTLLGTFAQFIFNYISFRKFGLKLKINKVLINKNIINICKLSVLIIAGLAVSQIILIMDRFFASNFSEGYVTAFMLCNKLIQLPVGVLGSSIATVIFPIIANFAIEKQGEDIEKVVSKTIISLIFITVPIMMFINYDSLPIIKILFERGQFSEADSILTANVFSLYALSILPLSLIIILTRIFNALQKNKTPIFIGMIALAIKIITSIVLIEKIGPKGLIYSTIFTNYILVFLSIFSINSMLGNIFLNKKMMLDTCKIILAAVIPIILLRNIEKLIIIENLYMDYSIRAVVFIFLYVILSILFKNEQVTVIYHKVKFKLLNRKKISV